MHNQSLSAGLCVEKIPPVPSCQPCGELSEVFLCHRPTPEVSVGGLYRGAVADADWTILNELVAAFDRAEQSD